MNIYFQIAGNAVLIFHDEGEPKLRLQYTQVVILDFFERRDGLPGLIRWPHVSISTLDKVGKVDDPEKEDEQEDRYTGRGLRRRRYAGRRPRGERR